MNDFLNLGIQYATQFDGQICTLSLCRLDGRYQITAETWFPDEAGAWGHEPGDFWYDFGWSAFAEYAEYENAPDFATPEEALAFAVQKLSRTDLSSYTLLFSILPPIQQKGEATDSLA